ncbi:hypothetical protein BDZ89DRAFT_1132467 [Hymenopellis radicata]|nr:hypothetical protein BDZ89DRAFT_1132467 [Hymenopellis radicata]
MFPLILRHARTEAFDCTEVFLKSLLTTFQYFLPASAITTPTASGAKGDSSSSSSGHSGFFDVAHQRSQRSWALSTEFKRCATAASKSPCRVDAEKLSLLRNPLASKRDEKRILGRSATTPWKPSSEDSRRHTKEIKGIPPPPLPRCGKLPEVFETQRSTTMGPGLETAVGEQMKALSLGSRHPPPARKPVPALSPREPPS